MPRNVELVLHGEPVTEGAGVRLRRMFGYYEAPMFDPFLLLDDFRSDRPEDFIRGFPWHPHRGIETITYILRGDVEHGDSMGNKGVISSGDVQWMTAGSGIIHQEMPKGDAHGAMHGFQLWANLPASHKMMEPRYRSITADEIPVAQLPQGVTAKVIAGTVPGAAGPVTGPAADIVTDPGYLDLTIPAGVTHEHPVPHGHTAIAYVIDGTGVIIGTVGETAGETAVANRTLALFKRADGAHATEGNDTVAFRADADGLRLLLFTGRPLGEPVAWRGPIVMNTDAELETAFHEVRAGTFIRHPTPGGLDR
ncbi:pirin family protein [Nitratidesulfovibrio termitidis]|uniref:pirin family protein n=1 Tax=Nitratidesulfovibrio termitidis TaxID=42252 RepID=UPI0004187700|nr:pirin family protein [Nitratidesulfovibrio termitidis]